MKTKRSAIGTLSALGISVGLALVVVVSAVAFFPSPTVNYGNPGLALGLFGRITVTSSNSGAGMLNITIINGANSAYPGGSPESNSIVNITVTAISPSIAGINSAGIAFLYKGSPVSESNPLPLSATAATRTLEISSGLVTGTTYVVTITATLSGGQSVTQAMDILVEG